MTSPARVALRRCLLRVVVVAQALCAGLVAGPAFAAGTTADAPRPARQHVDPAAVQAGALEAASAWLAKQPVSRFEVVLGSPVPEVEVAAGAWSLAARPIGAGQPPVGRLIVWMDVRVANRLERSVPVTIQVRSFADRWKARADLPARSPVGQDAFELSETELVQPYASAPRELPFGMRLSRALAAGQVLQWTHLEAAADVTRGDVVAAHLNRGLVRVQTRAEALQDGRSGQQVQVRITGATGPVHAQVIGPGAVQVNE